MKFRSVIGQSGEVSFSAALLHGVAPDGGLYIPGTIPKLPQSLLEHPEEFSLQEIAFQILGKFLEEIPEQHLRQIIQKSLNFPIPLVNLSESLFLVELFHGPTLAFKDVGARFMAEVLSYVLNKQQREVTILVATSGDTGSAVAHGFYDVPHIQVYVLYPSGKISKLQEQQMTTLGGNVHAIEVEGTFDDCQHLVKQALADSRISAARSLTTANSINLGRLLPQIVYYVWAFAQWKKNSSEKKVFPVVIVPSGNLGNLTAAIYAKWMGIPFQRFIAAANANDVVPKYFQSGVFSPMPSVHTLSNAMDVGNPSNLSRLQSLYQNDVRLLRKDVESVSISDRETIEEIRRVYSKHGYILDPHTAVGMAAGRKQLSSLGEALPRIVAATAHPAKFHDTVQKAIGIEIPLPPSLKEALQRKKEAIHMVPRIEALQEILL